jgi:hypothetical protein
MQAAADNELQAAIKHDKDQKSALGIVEPANAIEKAKDRMAQVRSTSPSARSAPSVPSCTRPRSA